MNPGQHHGCQFTLVAVETARLGEVKIGDHIAAYHKERPVDDVSYGAHGSRRSQPPRWVLMIRNFHSPFGAIPEIFFDRFREKIGEHEDLGKTMTDKKPHDVLEHGEVGHRHHWLGTPDGQRPEPCPVPSCHYHGFQNIFPLRAHLQRHR